MVSTDLFVCRSATWKFGALYKNDLSCTRMAMRLGATERSCVFGAWGALER
jgi:hypothetical protein